jgi:hypothetical protein
MEDNLEVDAQDVVRLMLQFCKENGLKESLRTLQTETQVSATPLSCDANFFSAAAPPEIPPRDQESRIIGKMQPGEAFDGALLWFS